MTDDEIRKLVGDAFVGSPRPVHFTHYTHCSECEDHDNVLRSKSVATVTLAEIGHPGWDPICFITPEGFRYYFPALVRLALTEKEDCYVSQFLFHVSDPDNPVQHFSCFTRAQKEIVLTVIRHIRDRYPELIGECGDEDKLPLAIDQWEEFVTQ